MNFYTVALYIAIFLNTSLSSLFNIKLTTTFAYLPLVIVIIIQSYTRNLNYLKKKNIVPFLLLLIGIVYVLIQLLNGQNYIKNIIMYIYIPLFLAMFFDYNNIKQTNILRRALIVFFIIECSIAIIERAKGTTFFVFDDNELFNEYYNVSESWDFRSTSLLGNPLTNAMVVTTILTFIISSSLNIKYKIYYFFLGFLALFCFNARGAIIVTGLVIFPYLLYQLKLQIKSKRKLYIYFSFIIGILSILFFYLYTTSLGGRLFNNQEVLIDGSALTRIEVFKFYKYLDFRNLLLGSSDNYLFLMNKLAAGGVENGIITLLISYGIIFTPIILGLLLKFQYDKMNTYKKIDKIVILFVFYLVGNMNPNLASPIQWIMFVYGIYAFKSRPLNLKSNKLQN
jgi:hypothetical protein